MREFTSIHVSAYDAGSLADHLTEQSRRGWNVVAIVSTGSSVTAYLDREATEASAADATALAAGDHSGNGDDTSDGEQNDNVYDSDTEVASLAAGDGERGDGAVAEGDDNPYSSDSEVASLAGSAGVSAAATSAAIDASDDSSAAKDDGHAATSDGSANAESTETASADAPENREQPSDDSHETGEVGWAAGSQHDDTPHAGTQTDHTEAQQTTQHQQANANLAPAGWYADPADRFELRYWDGGQWTEHVARQGQQYTDPPVA